ncbi:MAG: PKD domain-containing protein [Actinomycetota bacterium]|nr:PKD domain-containing protein [Actinomycetota bacterium]
MRRLGAWLVALIAVGACVGITAGPASGYVTGGQRWPSHRIPYFDTGPDHAAVRAAVRAWNTSGANLRFVPVARRAAHVLIVELRPPGCYGVDGFGTLGYSHQGDRVQLRACPNRAQDAIVAAHELGHVLGLNHELHGCATMNPAAQLRCGLPRPYFTNCRLLERDDIRGAISRYGGHLRPIHSPQFCPQYSRPRPATSMTVTGNTPPAQQLWATLQIPRERRLIIVPGFGFKQTGPQLLVSLYRHAGSCPPGAPHGHPVSEGTPSHTGRLHIALDPRAQLKPGPWCYAAWTRDAAGRRAARATTFSVVVAHQSPTAAFYPPEGNVAGIPTQFYDASNQGDDPITAWSWNFGDGTATTGTDSQPTHTYDTAGTYTVILTVTASDGQTSTVSHPVAVDPSGG